MPSLYFLQIEGNFEKIYHHYGTETLSNLACSKSNWTRKLTRISSTFFSGIPNIDPAHVLHNIRVSSSWNFNSFVIYHKNWSFLVCRVPTFVVGRQLVFSWLRFYSLIAIDVAKNQRGFKEIDFRQKLRLPQNWVKSTLDYISM